MFWATCDDLTGGGGGGGSGAYFAKKNLGLERHFLYSGGIGLNKSLFNSVNPMLHK